MYTTINDYVVSVLFCDELEQWNILIMQGDEIVKICHSPEELSYWLRVTNSYK